MLCKASDLKVSGWRSAIERVVLGLGGDVEVFVYLVGGDGARIKPLGLVSLGCALLLLCHEPARACRNGTRVKMGNDDMGGRIH